MSSTMSERCDVVVVNFRYLTMPPWKVPVIEESLCDPSDSDWQWESFDHHVRFLEDDNIKQVSHCPICQGVTSGLHMVAIED